MNEPTHFQVTWLPRALGALRIVAGYLLTAHGSTRILQAPNEAFSSVTPASLGGILGLMQIVIGPLLVLGLCTRATAFMASGLMASAYFIRHAPEGNVWVPILNGGELAALYSFVFLFLAVAGPGSWSWDNYHRRNTSFLLLRRRASATR